MRCCAGFLILIHSSLLALDPGKSIDQYVVTSWTLEDGLPQNAGQAIVQTSDGYLWIGTQEGLARFDGQRFRIFDSRNTSGFTNHFVNTLYESRDSTLWIGTNGGVYTYRSGKLTDVGRLTGLSNLAVNAIREDRYERLWVATSDGLYMLAPSTTGWRRSSYRTADGLSHPFVKSLLIDGDRVWIGSREGLDVYENGKITKIPWAASTSSQFIQWMEKSRDGILWAGLYGGGLVTLQNGKIEKPRTQVSLTNDFVMCVMEDRDGAMWVGTYGGGIGRLAGGTWEHFLQNDFVISLYEDRQGNIWIGTFGQGVYRLRDGRLTTYTKKHGLPDNNIWSVMQDRQGAMWMGTNGGVSRYDGLRFQNWTTAHGLAHDVVWSLAEAGGAMWIGTQNGLSRLDVETRRVTTYRREHGLTNTVVNAIADNGHGGLWIGTDEGVDVFQDGRFEPLNGALKSSTVMELHRDRRGRLWIGSRQGLFRYENNRLDTIALPHFSPGVFVSVVAEDSADEFWLGSWGGGLTRVVGDRITSITSREGLFDDIIYTIVDDRRGRLWMTSSRGIFSIKKDEVRNGGPVRCNVYGVVDGMKTRECNGGSKPAGWRSRDGSLWFPTLNGVVRAAPGGFERHVEFPVVIQEVVVDGRPMSGDISQETAAHNVEFHYAALDFSRPEKIKYRYRLESFDDGWIDAGDRRVAYYTRIPSGQYRFLVAAKDDRGFEKTAALTFSVQPQFHESPLFYFLIVAAIGGGAYTLFLLRVRRIRRLQLELQHLVEERTAELQAAKQLSESQKKELEQTLSELRGTQTRLIHSEKMASLGRMVAGVAHEINNPLTFIHGNLQFIHNRLSKGRGGLKETGAMDELLGAIRSSLNGSQRIKSTVELLRRLTNHESLPYQLIDINDHIDGVTELFVKQHVNIAINKQYGECPLLECQVAEMNLALMNLMDNAVQAIRRAERKNILDVGAGVISITTRTEDDWVIVTIRDNGVGMSKETMQRAYDPFFTTYADHQGLGLTEVHHIMERHEAFVELNSTEGKGTTVTLKLPL